MTGLVGLVSLVAVVAEPGDEPIPGVVAVVVVLFAAVLTVGLRIAVLAARRVEFLAARACVITGRRGMPSGGLGAGEPLGPAPRRVCGTPRIGQPRIVVARVVVQRLWRLRL
jgi:hypothetical protein